jgi:hypothetical protein
MTTLVPELEAAGELYFVLCDFGKAFVETDPARADRETVVEDNGIDTPGQTAHWPQCSSASRLSASLCWFFDFSRPHHQRRPMVRVDVPVRELFGCDPILFGQKFPSGYIFIEY